MRCIVLVAFLVIAVLSFHSEPVNAQLDALSGLLGGDGGGLLSGLLGGGGGDSSEDGKGGSGGGGLGGVTKVLGPVTGILGGLGKKK